MQKKLEAELVSLAHSILQMKNRDEAIALKEKARLLYEKLAVLTLVDDYVATTPNLDSSKEEILKSIEAKLDPSETKKRTASPAVQSPKEATKTSKTTESKEIFEPKFDDVKIDIQSLKSNQISSKEEFKDSISADKTATLFEDDKGIEDKKSLNDKLLKNTIQVGLNDRIAFVNHLFNFDQADFNRVLSQLNTFKNEKQAIDFINNKIKPEYNWEGKETYEERLISLIERKFS